MTPEQYVRTTASDACDQIAAIANSSLSLADKERVRSMVCSHQRFIATLCPTTTDAAYSLFLAIIARQILIDAVFAHTLQPNSYMSVNVPPPSPTPPPLDPHSPINGPHRPN